MISRIVNSESRFSLIQGSSGTGKTRTIIGLISTLLTRNPNARILACAPSSSAVDELVKRLEHMKVVRIGSSENTCNDVKKRTLDFLTRKTKVKFNCSLDSARQEVLSKANVICSTLVFSGHEVLNIFKEFDCVIVDDADQAIELSTLIPLKFNPKRCILVGDPSSPTQYVYGQSFFVRVKNNFKNYDSITLLDTQYRMHPQISKFPRTYFHDSRLKDSQEIVNDAFRKWHSHKLFPPYMFYNIGQSDMTKDIKYSSIEARIMACAYKRLVLDFPSIKDASIILLYTCLIFPIYPFFY